MRIKRSTAKTMLQAKELRREPTPPEEKLWAQLRGNRLNGVSFRRQHAIGPYITDFCSPKKKLVIELDGSQHLQQQEYDKERTGYLESQGFRVLRFWNDDVLNNMSTVLMVILEAVQ
jgi:very-short-patch-repair endonuclease